MSLDYRNWIRVAKERLVALEQQRQAIDTEIAALEQSIRAFEPIVNMPNPGFPSIDRSHPAYTSSRNLGWLTNDPELQDIGLTEAVRAVFRNAPGPLEPLEVRDLLLHSGFDLSGRSNAMANVHQVIRRLITQGEIQESSPSALGKNRYRWIEKPKGLLEQFGGLVPPDPEGGKQK